MICPHKGVECPVIIGRWMTCPVHGARLTEHWRKLCQEDTQFFGAWVAGKGPGQDRPAKLHRRALFLYKTDAERLAMIEERIEEFCQGSDCDCYNGSQFEGTPIDICACAGCRQSGRQDIHRLRQRCPRGKWSLLLKP